MVLRDAVSAFCKKRRLPLSSTMQMVTSTLSFLASASAAATIVLMAARLTYFLLGKSAEYVVATKHNRANVRLNMYKMSPLLSQFLAAMQFPVQLLRFRIAVAVCQVADESPLMSRFPLVLSFEPRWHRSRQSRQTDCRR